jgi:hypothetical protein
MDMALHRAADCLNASVSQSCHVGLALVPTRIELRVDDICGCHPFEVCGEEWRNVRVDSL